MSGGRDDCVPLRIATFNTHLLPYLISASSRAESIAERVAQRSYDLIGFSEVFSRRCKRKLIDHLSQHYQHGVWNLGSSHRFRLDSGLMLFSKVPLEGLPQRGSIARCENYSGAQRYRSSSNVLFQEYTDRCCSDGLATKGCAYVRIHIRGHPLHVFLTHIQASYMSHTVRKYLATVTIRAAQIRQMADFIKQVVGVGSLRRENVLLMGDFNVHWSATGAGYPHRGAKLHGDEGQMMFRTLGSLFPGGLVDIWNRYGPAGDPGFTYPAADPSTRPDHILLSAADHALPLCAQQVAVARHLVWDGRRGRGKQSLLSDHLGVEAELNITGPLSSIRDARVLSVESGSLWLQGYIEHSGGFQWYRLAAPGSYEIQVGGTEGRGAMRVEVYAEKDLSHSLVPQRNRATDKLTVREYVVAGPSYLRIGDPRVSTTGAYSLHVRKLGP